ncbi:MAG: sodium-dependent transporter [Chlamydiales bacterium]
MKPRENWGSRIGFLMATVGSAIGLGSLWKFPYATGDNGGGAFVLAYLIFTFCIGLPVFMGELVIGRSSQRSPVNAFGELSELQKNWRIVGWSCVLVTLLVLSFYIVVSGWALNYVFMSILNFTQGKTTEEIGQVFDILYSAADINILYSLLFLALTTAIVYRGIRKGIEFWSKILTPALLIILILLFIYGLTLEGFGEAFRFVFYPKLSELSPSGLLQALGLACFTLSVGMGIIITYGSYMRRDEDIPKSAATVVIMDIAVSLLASLMIFPIIFTFGFSPQEGPGLLFKTLPVIFAKLPATILLSTVFFSLVVFAALTSTISVMEVLVSTTTDTFQWSRQKGALIVSVAVFILSIPSALSGSDTLFKNWAVMYGKNFFDSLDYFAFTWLLPLNAIMIAIFAGWVMEKAVQSKGLLEGSKWIFVFRPWLFLLRWVVPVAVVLIMLEQGGIIDIDVIALKVQGLWKEKH